jgi:hypothetical protein
VFIKLHTTLNKTWAETYEKVKTPFREEAACRTHFFRGSAALNIGEHRKSVAESDETSGRSSSEMMKRQ